MKIPGSCRQSIQWRSPSRPGWGRRLKGRCRGSGLVELLVASLLLCIGLMGLVNTWAFSFRVTQNTDDRGVAYILARQAMERVKMSGFANTAEGTTTAYYTASQATTTSGSSTAYFSVVTSVVSDQMQSGTSGIAGGVPSQQALRTVTVTVNRVPSGQKVFSTSTYLVRAGI